MTAQNLPGVASGRTVTPRRILQQAGKDREIVVSVLLDGTNGYDGSRTGYEKYIRAGWLLARDATSGKFVPCKRSKANAAGSASTSLVVDNAAAFVAGDSITIGTNAAVAISSIVYSTNTITLASAKTWGDNDPVFVAGGQGIARAILLDDEVILRNQERTANSDKRALAIIRGFVDQDQVLGDVSAVLEDYDSAVALNGVVFDDYQGGVDALPLPFAPFSLRRMQLATGNYTVTANDNGTLFIANAAATFTLPTKAAGLIFGFSMIADANLVIASAGSADDIIHKGDAAADSVTFSTTSEKIGSSAVVAITPDVTKWLCFNVGGTTATVA